LANVGLSGTVFAAATDRTAHTARTALSSPAIFQDDVIRKN
jgi:hypothetical protein